MARTVYHLLSENEPFSENRGGAISRWAANVLRRDNNAVILCPSTDESWRFPAARIVTIRSFHRYETVRRASTYLPWWLSSALIRYLLIAPIHALLRPGDVLWVHNRPDYAAILAPTVHRAGARIVLHMHNSHLLAMLPWRLEQAKIDHFVFVSTYLQGESLHRFPWISSSVLYNGANETMFYPSSIERTPPAVPEILFASRLVRDKGAHIFVDAMRVLEQAGIRAKGIIVGASHFGGSRVTRYITDLHKNAPSNVEFRPYCSGSELAKLFRTVDIFCLPSVWQDPFPLAPLEAMASRLPVVATESGGIPEAFSEGGALLVDRSSVDQLVQALRDLITNPALRQKIAAEGRLSFLKNYTWTVVQGRYQTIMEELAA